MNILSNEIHFMICKLMVLQEQFGMLLVNTYYRKLCKEVIVFLIHKRGGIFAISYFMQTMALRCSTCFNCNIFVPYNQHKSVTYYKSQNCLRSDTAFVIAEWWLTKRSHRMVMNKRQVNSIMLSYFDRGIQWDRMFHAHCMRRRPDRLLFVQLNLKRFSSMSKKL